jgi:hypothetical protein
MSDAKFESPCHRMSPFTAQTLLLPWHLWQRVSRKHSGQSERSCVSENLGGCMFACE